MLIYSLRDPRPGHPWIYIGMTEDVRGRYKRHCKWPKRGRGKRACWIRKLLKLELRPELYVLEEGFNTREEMAEAEVFWIAYHKMFWPDDVLNETDGGDAGFKLSTESKKRISEKLKGKHKGRVHSEESKKNMGEAHLGLKMPPRTVEHRRKLSDATAGRRTSAETKKKISDTLKRKRAEGQLFSEEHRRKIAEGVRRSKSKS